MKKNFCKGQGMIEYILLFASIIAILLVVLAPRRGFVYNAIESSLDISFNALDKKVQKYNIYVITESIK